MSDNRGGGHSIGREDASRERVLAAVSAYGADPERWPAELRALADVIGLLDEALSSELAAQAELDAALAALPAARVPDALRRKLIADFEKWAHKRSRSHSRRVAAVLADIREAVWPGAPWWKPACAFAVSLVIGLWAGLILPDRLSRETSDQTVAFFDAPSGIDLDQSEGG